MKKSQVNNDALTKEAVGNEPTTTLSIVRTKFSTAKVETFESQLNKLSTDDAYKLKGIVNNVMIRMVNINREMFQIGSLLSQAKEILPHGTFTPFIEHSFGNTLPYSTAFAFLKIYDKFKNDEKTVQYIPMTLLMNMTQRSFPENITNLINENAEFVEQADVQVINSAFKLFKEGEINLHDFEKLAQEQIDAGISIERGNTEKRISTHARGTLQLGIADLASAIRKVRDKVQKMQFLFPPVEGNGEEKKLADKIQEIITELDLLKEDIQNRSGLFKPQLSLNPMKGKEFITNESDEIDRN